MIINEVKTNNEHNFEEKAQDLNEKEQVTVWSQQLEVVIAQAYSELPELKIPAKLASMEKIKKIPVVVKESNDEIYWVSFEVQLQISKFQLSL